MPGAPQRADPAGAAISAFLSSTRGPQTAPSTASAGRRPDAVIRQSEAITPHATWLTAKAAWRGLKLVLSARDRGTKPAFKLRDLGGESITDALANDAFIGAPAEGAQEERWNAILVIGAFGASVNDLEALRHLALLGYASQTPVIVSLAADFFGKPAAEVAAMDNPAALLDLDSSDSSFRRRCEDERERTFPFRWGCSSDGSTGANRRRRNSCVSY